MLAAPIRLLVHILLRNLSVPGNVGVRPQQSRLCQVFQQALESHSAMLCYHLYSIFGSPTSMTSVVTPWIALVNDHVRVRRKISPWLILITCNITSLPITAFHCFTTSCPLSPDHAVAECMQGDFIVRSCKLRGPH